ncbi:hypothetical protein [Azorhizophilus paspali]
MVTTRTAQPLRITLTGILALLMGALMALGGAYLAILGGSWYYLLAGLGLLAVGILILARRRLAIWLYAVLLLATLAWTIYEAGSDWWRLVARIDLWWVLGLWLLLPFVNRHIGVPARWRDGASGLLGIAVLFGALLAGYALTRDHSRIAGEFAAERMAGASPAGAADRSASEWPAYGGSARGDRYSAADLITPGNVGRLKKAWEYHTGDWPREGDPAEFTNQVTPLKVGDSLFICTPHSLAIALDADSGEELWRFDPNINRDAKYYQHMTCRGLAYHDAAAYPGAGERPPPALPRAAAAGCSCRPTTPRCTRWTPATASRARTSARAA